MGNPTRKPGRPTHTDSRGQPLDYETGQIHEQTDAFGSGGRHRDPPLTLRNHLDRLANVLDGQGRTDAAVTLTPERYRQAEHLLRYAMLDGSGPRWRKHPLLKVAEEPKL